MTDLHARLLAEIERREGDLPLRIIRRGSRAGRERAYLAALQGVVEIHTDFAGGCHECEYDYPCATLRCVAEGLGVEVDG